MYNFIFYFIYQPFETSSIQNADEKYLALRKFKGKMYGKAAVFFTLFIHLFSLYILVNYFSYHFNQTSLPNYQSKTFKNQGTLTICLTWLSVVMYYNKKRMDAIISKYDQTDFYTTWNILKFMAVVILPPIVLAAYIAA